MLRVGRSFLILLLVCGAFQAHAWDRLDLEKSNQLYLTGKYEEAAKGYENFLKKNPNHDQGHYNLGDAYYRLGRFSDAQAHYEQALNSSDPKLREKALYNIGNALYRQEQLKPAVDSYNKVLEMNPENEKARLNRDFILKRLEQEKPPPQPENKEQDSTEEQKQESEGEGDKEDKKDKKDPNQEPQAKQSPPEQKQEAGSGGEEPKPSEPQEKQGQPEQPSGEGPAKNPKPLSQQEADRWLEAIEDNPKGAMKDILRREAGEDGPSQNTNKDW